ncbi:MAG: hypothetical protein M3Y24_06520 [Acidobacteriota bacterium]|nr:hypothetical protein [Acidobacteriota bacterium]
MPPPIGGLFPSDAEEVRLEIRPGGIESVWALPKLQESVLSYVIDDRGITQIDPQEGTDASEMSAVELLEGK